METSVNNKEKSYEVTPVMPFMFKNLSNLMSIENVQGNFTADITEEFVSDTLNPSKSDNKLRIPSDSDDSDDSDNDIFERKSVLSSYNYSDLFEDSSEDSSEEEFERKSILLSSCGETYSEEKKDEDIDEYRE